MTIEAEKKTLHLAGGTTRPAATPFDEEALALALALEPDVLLPEVPLDADASLDSVTLPASGMALVPVAVPTADDSVTTLNLAVAEAGGAMVYVFDATVETAEEPTALATPPAPAFTTLMLLPDAEDAESVEVFVRAWAMDTWPLSRSKTTYMLLKTASPRVRKGWSVLVWPGLIMKVQRGWPSVVVF